MSFRPADVLPLTVSFLQVTVRSLGWIELQEESLTSENSSKAVNRCIVQLSSAADNTEILDRCVKHELARTGNFILLTYAPFLTAALTVEFGRTFWREAATSGWSWTERVT